MSGPHSKSPPSFRRSTRIAHAGLDSPSPETGDRGARPHAPPIYQTSGFEYPDARQAEEAAEGQRYIYSRYASPNEDMLAGAIAALEGAEAAMVFASGMGAIAAALESRLATGDHVVSVHGLYGGTHELLVGLLPRFGVTTTFVDEATAAAVAPAITQATKVVYVESISNPLLRVADLDGLATLCRERGVALLVDATFATPLLCRPIERGATLSIHSGTKYLGGHGDAICGVVSGSAADVARLSSLRKLHGASLDPFAAWLVLRGLRTMGLRVERQVASAATIARGLVGVRGVERVWYPGLESHPDHALATRVLDGPGAMVSFEVAGGLDGARRVYDRLTLVTRAASLGEITSLMTHPARFSHLRVDAESRRRAGIADGLLRLSVGIEDPDDLLEDLRQAIT